MTMDKSYFTVAVIVDLVNFFVYLSRFQLSREGGKGQEFHVKALT